MTPVLLILEDVNEGNGMGPEVTDLPLSWITILPER